MSAIQFVTHRNTKTQYQIVEAWDIAFKQWCESHNPAPSWDHIAMISDEQVWALYESHIRTALAPLNRPITTLL